MPKDFILYALFGGHFCAFVSSHFRNNKKSGEKILRNIRNIRNIFQFAIRTKNKQRQLGQPGTTKNTGFCPVLLFTIPLHKKQPVHAVSQAHL